jgi:nucleoside-diphosphate-sugar epimerase
LRIGHTESAMPTKPLPTEDLIHILTLAREPFESLRGANVFITGGTGFFGHWLLESLLYANAALSLNARATVLTRSIAAFRDKSPHIAGNAAITLLESDMQTFAFPAAPHSHIVHAATDSGTQQAAQTPQQLYDSILNGTLRVLEFAEQTGATRMLYTSTGAVYGRSTTLLHTPESFLDNPALQLPPLSYEAAKRASELLCLEHPQINPVMARCFAFVGPHLPLDQHFAIGNFLDSALHNRPIHIKGDGTPRRSWLYMADLAVWLWTLLANGTSNLAYNVGSDNGMTIAEAARLTAATLHQGLEIRVDGRPSPKAPLNSYVPDISRAKELGLAVRVPLDEALRRTTRWCRGTIEG